MANRLLFEQDYHCRNSVSHIFGQIVVPDFVLKFIFWGQFFESFGFCLNLRYPMCKPL